MHSFASKPASGSVPPLLRAALLSCLTLLSAACGANLAPVLNVENAPVVTATGETPATKAFVRDAIIRALSSRGWQLEQETPDGITASVSSGGHSATAQIQYDERTYSIHYVDSSPGLKYNGSSIHRRYNHWIDRLRAAIRAQLASSAPVPEAVPADATLNPALPPPGTAPAPDAQPAPGEAPPPPPPAPPAAPAQ